MALRSLIKSSAAVKPLSPSPFHHLISRTFAGKRVKEEKPEVSLPDYNDDVPTSGISRPLSEILKEINKRVPDSLVKLRTESNGFAVKYIPWYIFLSFISFNTCDFFLNLYK